MLFCLNVETIYDVNKWNIGWASHSAHHSSEEYNLSTALRQGFLQEVISFPFNLVLAIVGVHPYLFSTHSNINT